MNVYYNSEVLIINFERMLTRVRILEVISRALILSVMLMLTGLKVNAQALIHTVLPQEEVILFDSTIVFEWNSSLNETSTSNYELKLFVDSNATAAFYTHRSKFLVDSVNLSTPGVFYWTVSLIDNERKLEESSIHKFTYADLYKLPDLNLLFLTDTGLVINSSNEVSRWINLADTSRSAVQSIDSLSPKLILQDSLINGSRILSFDGKDDHLSVIQSVNMAELYTLANWEGGTTFNALKGLITGRIGGTIFRGAASSTTFGNSQVFPSSIYVNQILSNDFAPLQEYKFLFGRRNSVFPITNGLLFGSDFKVSNRYWNGHIGDILGFSAPLNDSLHQIVVSYFCQKYRQALSLGKDIVTTYGFCDTSISVDTNYTSYLWSNGDTTANTSVPPGQSVSLTVTNDFGCSYADEIHVKLPLPEFTDVQICPGDTFVWNTSLNKNDYTFKWNDLSADSLLYIDKAGEYYLEISDTNNCTYFSDTINVGIDSSILKYSLGNDTSLCEGSSIGLVNNDSMLLTYGWNTGSILPRINIDTSGAFILSFSNNICSATDTINVIVKGKNPKVDFQFEGKFLGDTSQFTDNTVVFGMDTILNWAWTFGDDSLSILQNPSHLYGDTGRYDVGLRIETDKNCLDSISKSIRIRPRPPVIKARKTQNDISIITPIDESIIFDNDVVFSWNAFPDLSSPINYVITIAVDSSFNQIRHLDTLQVNSDSVTLANNQEYHWKIEAINGQKIIASSALHSFTLSNLFNLPNLNLLFLTDTGLQITAQFKVSKWTNLADTALSAVQSSANSMPSLQNGIAELNSNAAIKFDGTDDYLSVVTQFNLAELYTIANYEGGQTFDALKGLITGRVGGTIFRGSASSTTFGNSQVFGDSIFINANNTKEFAPLESYKWISGKRNSSFPIGSGIYLGSDFLLSNRYWDGGIADIVGFDSPISDSIRNIVKSYFCKKYRNNLSLGKDLVLNYGFCDTLIQADTTFTTYEWSNGDTNSYSRLLPGQSYQLSVTNDLGCTYVDEIRVRLPIRYQGDALLCPGDSLVWNTNLSSDQYEFNWNGNEGDSLQIFHSAGNYYVQITDTNGCAYQSDTIQLSFDSSLLAISLGNDTSICRGASIELNNNNGVLNYQWSNGSNQPSIQIDSSGVYIVVFENQQCSNLDTVHITIKGDPPQANFLFNDLCFRDSVRFKDSSLVSLGDSIVKWEWNFGDGAIDSIRNPTHNYANDIRYTVSLQVTTDKNCMHDTSISFTIKAKPTALFSSRKSCAQEVIEYRNRSVIDRGSVDAFQWKFGDSTHVSNTSFQEDPTHAYDTFGTYFVELIVTSNQGCKDTLILPKYINPLPDLSFNTLGSCLRDSIEFTSTSTLTNGEIAAYLWVINNQQLTAEKPKIKFLNAGEKQVVLRLRTDSSCQSVMRDTISIFDNPKADIFDENFCEGLPFRVQDKSTSVDSIMNYTFVFQADTSNDVNPKFKSDSAGTFELNHFVSTINGCQDSNQYFLQINENPKAQFQVLNSAAGIPFKVYIENNSLRASKYQWDFGNGDSDSIELPSYTYLDTGKYTIQLIAIGDAKCRDTISRSVQALPAYLDAAIQDIFLNEDLSGALEVSVRIVNTGNNTIENIELVADVNNTFQLREKTDAIVFTGDIENYTFSSKYIQETGRKVDFVCVRILQLNEQQDQNESNNEICEKAFNNRFYFSVFPNPVKEFLNIEFVPTEEGQMQLDFFNQNGTQVKESRSMNVENDLYRLMINVEDLPNGVYHYRFILKGNQRSGTFIKID